MLATETEVCVVSKRQFAPYWNAVLFSCPLSLRTSDPAKSITLLAFITLSAAQSSAQTFIHSAILVNDTSNNASYNQVHWLVKMLYLSIKASNDVQ